MTSTTSRLPNGDAPPEATAKVPFGKLLGIGPRGVPAFSNGSETHFSGKASAPPCNERLVMGVTWQCVEYARRYILAAKGCYLPNVAIAEDIWQLPAVVHTVSKQDVSMRHFLNGSNVKPIVGDLLVWRRNADVPFGHVAVVAEVSDSYVRVAEQNMEPFSEWGEGKNWSRELRAQEVKTERGELKKFEVFDDHLHPLLLGWSRVDMVDLDPTVSDWMDVYRVITSPGSLERKDIDEEKQSASLTLPWVDPTRDGASFFLHRSLATKTNSDGVAVAASVDVPSGYYTLDYDLWMRLKKGATELHRVALQACHHVLKHQNSTDILRDQFGIPEDLHALLRASFETTPCLGGRFDFGFDGKNLKVFEYNSDSSAALLECGETQSNWAQWAGLEKEGQSTGQLVFGRLVYAWSKFKQRLVFAPSHATTGPRPNLKAPTLIHFLVDDDDEERYTALYTMRAAEVAGFKTKMIIGLRELHVKKDGTIVDSNGERLFCVWKTWSWDTVLKDYDLQKEKKQKAENSHVVIDGEGSHHHFENGNGSVVLNDSIANDHQLNSSASNGGGNNTPPPAPIAAAELNASIASSSAGADLTNSPAAQPEGGMAMPSGNHPAVPKKPLPHEIDPTLVPVSLPKLNNPTLSQVMLNPDICVLEPMWKLVVGNKALLPYMAELAPDHDNLLKSSFSLTPELRASGYVSKPVSGRAGQNIELHPAEKAGPKTPTTTSHPGTPQTPMTGGSFAEVSGGRFGEALTVYQERLKLKQFKGQYYPILCAWVIDDAFAGVVIREDTSLITKLESVVVPARVIRWKQEEK